MSDATDNRFYREKQGGLEPIPEHERPCQSQQHLPPTHIHIPYGMQYRHICPSCGCEVVLRSSEVYFNG
jgi:hypothetical protein